MSHGEEFHILKDLNNLSKKFIDRMVNKSDQNGVFLLSHTLKFPISWSVQIDMHSDQSNEFSVDENPPFISKR